MFNLLCETLYMIEKTLPEKKNATCIKHMAFVYQIK